MLGIYRIAFKKAFIALAAISFLTLSSYATTQTAASHGPSLPPGVVQKGSLANQKLILDAGLGAAAKLATKGYRITQNQSFQPYVVSMPVGAPGQRSWTERWFYDINGNQVPVTIDFKESGLGAADFTIRNEP